MVLRYTYFIGKLEVMIESLAVGPGDIRDRFRTVGLEMAHINDDEIHPDFLPEWNSIMNKITKSGPNEVVIGE